MMLRTTLYTGFKILIYNKLAKLEAALRRCLPSLEDSINYKINKKRRFFLTKPQKILAQRVRYAVTSIRIFINPRITHTIIKKINN